MTVEKEKDQSAGFADLAEILNQTAANTGEDQQYLLRNLNRLPEPRPLHYHFSHDILPTYFARPENRAKLQRIMTNGGEEQLIGDLYQQTRQEYPWARRSFLSQEIGLSWHSMPSGWVEIGDFPLLLFTMPPPMAVGETFLAGVVLLPRLEFYNQQEWRYFVVDGRALHGEPPVAMLYEYLYDRPGPQKTGFLFVGECWPQADALLGTLRDWWDERFYTL